MSGPRRPISEPLGFRPIFKEKVWGGRRMADVLGKALPGPGPFGECWEISDCGSDLSVVRGGAQDGKTLQELIAGDPRAILGGAAAPFPLLFKTIDASSTLSVQVHPGEEDAALGIPGVASKTEAWVILDADPGARIVYGLAAGADREEFYDRAARGDVAGVEALLAWTPVRAGDVAFIPAGTIHAIGEGILLLEIQQSSDTTYRIHDWGRAGLDGRPRDLHIAQARAVRARPAGGCCPWSTIDGAAAPLGLLVECEPFRIEAVRLGPGESLRLPSGPGFGVLVGVRGRATVRGGAGGESREAGRGDFILLPAAAAGGEVRAGAGPFTGLWVREGS